MQDDLYIEILDAELDRIIKMEKDPEKLKLFKKKITLLKKIYFAQNNYEELKSKRDYVKNNQKYNILELAVLSFDLLATETKKAYLEDDLRITEESIHYDEVMDRINKKK